MGASLASRLALVRHPTSSPRLPRAQPHLHRDSPSSASAFADGCAGTRPICAGAWPHLRRDSCRFTPGLANICAGTRPHLHWDSPTSAPGLTPICARTDPPSALGLAHICAGPRPHRCRGSGHRSATVARSSSPRWRSSLLNTCAPATRRHRSEVSPVPAQMWQGRARSRRRRSKVEPGPGADVAGVSPVVVQMWPG
jgi:hypothetical protein